MSKNKRQNDSRKEIISDINRKLKTEKCPEQRKNLLSMKKKVELFDKAIKGDAEALIAVAEQRGMYKNEEQEKPKANALPENQKQLDAPKNPCDLIDIREKESKDDSIRLRYKNGKSEDKCGFTLDVTHEENAGDGLLKMYTDAVKKIVGVKEIELANHILQCASGAIKSFVGSENACFMNIILQFLHDTKPRDAIEAQLAAQAAALFTHSMSNLQRMGKAQTVQHVEAYANVSVKLSRAHNETVEALNRHRRGGEQKVTVTHAVLANQAVVNNYNGVGVPPENRGETPCQQCAEPKPEPTKTNPVLSRPWLTDDVDSTVEKVLAPRQRKEGKSSKM